MIPILRPCFQRPEMLRLSLEYQEKNWYQDKFMTFFFADHPADPEIMPILASYKQNKATIMRSARLDLTLNILEGYKWIFENIKTDFVAIIEDDIIVSQDWLAIMHNFSKNYWQDDILALNAGDLWDKGLSGNQSVLKHIDWYYSCASITSRAIFEKFILPHCRGEYYRNKDRYLRRHFPGILEGELLDQAGLFRRVRIKYNLRVICPVFRRFGHIGVYGRFQRESPLGNLKTAERYEILKNACHSKDELEKWVKRKTGNFVDFEENTDFKNNLYFEENNGI